MVVNRFELMKMRAENVRSSFSATSIIFGALVGFLIADGLEGRSLTIGQTALLSVWLFAFAVMAHNLLKLSENIVWRVPHKTSAILLLCILLPAYLIGFYQDIVPIDDTLWAALIPAWIISVVFVAVIERPKNKELTESER